MAQEIYGLTLGDVNFLKMLKRAHEGGRQNPPSSRLGNDIFDEPPQAPETYIALVPEDGIPAAEGDPDFITGTGTGTDLVLDYRQGDRPGSATCQIYRIINGVLESCDFTKLVWNLSGSAITQKWMTVVRDKFGNWLAQVGGAGGQQTCRFEITDTDLIDCGLCHAIVTVRSRPIGISRVEEENGSGKITVYDFGKCWLNNPPSLLLGKFGHAVYYEGLEECAADPATVLNRWEIVSLCCVESSC